MVWVVVICRLLSLVKCGKGDEKYMTVVKCNCRDCKYRDDDAGLCSLDEIVIDQFFDCKSWTVKFKRSIL